VCIIGNVAIPTTCLACARNLTVCQISEDRKPSEALLNAPYTLEEMPAALIAGMKQIGYLQGVTLEFESEASDSMSVEGDSVIVISD
jgi:hypothetical protein